MQCNIDQRGRRVRFIWGVLMLLLAAGAAGLGVFGVLSWVWATGSAAAFTALGVLGLYESRKGWCAVRAMGFKTRM